jgi:tetratricopeptide (TPR) repeat protein
MYHRGDAMPIVRKIAPPERDEPGRPPPGFPPLTRDAIRTWLGDATLLRGESYIKNRLFEKHRTEHTLKARCQGSAAQPYRVEATIGPSGGVERDDCTCPVGGQCKHVAALLLAWLDDPGSFAEVADLEATLEQRDKAELIALIRQMLARRPELESLLALPLPIAGQHRKPADAAIIRREVANVFRAAGREWGSVPEAARNLAPLVKLGDDYASLGDWRSAAAVYQAVIQGVTEHYGQLHDEHGDLHTIVNDCVAGLGECLREAADPAQREALLRALFEIYRWDRDFGGIDMGYEAPNIILEQATPSERELVARWVRDALSAGDSSSRSWSRQAFGGFLLRLAGDQIDDATYLRIARETGRWRDLVERLLALGRVDEAEAEARQASDNDLLDLADRLRQHGIPSVPSVWCAIVSPRCPGRSATSNGCASGRASGATLPVRWRWARSCSGAAPTCSATRS